MSGRPQYEALQTVLNHLDEPLTHYPFTGTVTDDGFAQIDFGASRSVRGVIRPGAALDFEIGPTGRVDEETLILLILNEHGVEEHDRIIFEDKPWRCVEQQKEYLNDFSMYRLQPDGRGEDIDDTSPGDEEDNPFQPVE